LVVIDFDCSEFKVYVVSEAARKLLGSDIPDARQRRAHYKDDVQRVYLWGRRASWHCPLKDTLSNLGRQIVASSSARPIIIRYSPGLLDSLFSVTWCLRPWGVEHETRFCTRQLARS
jgi:hypothetical protein